MAKANRPRACARCRMRKTKCEIRAEASACKGCETVGETCTYGMAPQPKKEAADAIEDRLARLKNHLEKALPGSDFAPEIDAIRRKAFWLTHHPGESYPESSTSASVSPACAISSDSDLQSMPAPAHDAEPDRLVKVTSVLEFPDLDENQRFLRSLFPENTSKLFLEVHPDDDDIEYMAQLFKNVDIGATTSTSNRYFGRSSGVSFLQLVLNLRDRTGASPMTWASLRYDLLKLQQASIRPNPTRPSYDFGDPDLIPDLVNLYFRYMNLNLPLLHRPTFERSIVCGLHLSNDKFAKTLVLVMAIGARYSRDPRTLEDAKTPWTRGEKWYRQLAEKALSVEETPSLFDLQYYCLHALFNIGSFHPEGCWITIGVGLRMAQDVAAHRRQSSGPTVEGELWKRAFWVLIVLDCEISAAYGRIPAMTSQDFDVDLPLEVDDEFWESRDDNSAHAFVQPAGKTSSVAFFNAMIRLSEIMETTLRAFYSVKRHALSREDIDTVAELDSGLNQWLESLPPTLRWDLENQDPMYRQLAIRIHTHYYLLQILLHRPFIPSPKAGQDNKFAHFPAALAMCTTGARKSLRMIISRPKSLDLEEDTYMSVGFNEMTSLSHSSLLLLSSLWDRKYADPAFDMNNDPDMRLVHGAMDLLRSCEHLWHDAELLRDMLEEMIYPKAASTAPPRDGALSAIAQLVAAQDDRMAADTMVAPWDIWIPGEDTDYPMLQETYEGHFLGGGGESTAYGF